ncbi:Uu.00g087590.m01.CDS01 [Anthostomella pinea]|uniref:Uu.00g087590.m01.CDS01 n=1 Tax=Anthostomella pinea TaxID=933095 RepID=A0AAI8VMG2_9PEZI|nr:Uu.00g087590.m01.CDS01 [Anthostomella pinea]
MAPRTAEELQAFGVMDPAMVAELSRAPVRDPQPSDPYYGDNSHAALRAHRATTLREKHHLRYIPGPIPDAVHEDDRKIRVRDGAEIMVRVYRPVKAPEAGSPLVVMYHEGGWSMGDLSDEETNCKALLEVKVRKWEGIVLTMLGLRRLAPEYRFPTWINDSWDALKWAAKNATSLGADPTQGFLVGGGSAGGNIAALLAHLARDEQLSPPLTGQYLCVPAITCFTPPASIPERYRAEYLSHPSVTPNTDPVLKSGEDFEALLTHVLGGSLDDPLMVPFLYGERDGRHHELPPVYLQVCGLDPLRDEGLVYERVLREEAGVRTRLDLYPGFGHYFWTNYPELTRSREFVEDTVKGIRWLLEQKA